MKHSEYCRAMEKLNRERSEKHRQEVREYLDKGLIGTDYGLACHHDEAYYAGQEKAYRDIAIRLEAEGL